MEMLNGSTYFFSMLFGRVLSGKISMSSLMSTSEKMMPTILGSAFVMVKVSTLRLTSPARTLQRKSLSNKRKDERLLTVS